MVDRHKVRQGDKINESAPIVKKVKQYQRIDGKGDKNLITSEDIERNGFRWYSADTIPEGIRNGDVFLVNTDVSKGQGIHWITVCKRQGNIYVFDPLGPNNDRDNNDIIIENLSASVANPDNIHIITKKSQNINANTCGWISLLTAAIWEQYPYDEPIEILNKKIKGDATDEIVAAFGLK